MAGNSDSIPHGKGWGLEKAGKMEPNDTAKTNAKEGDYDSIFIYHVPFKVKGFIYRDAQKDSLDKNQLHPPPKIHIGPDGQIYVL